MGIKERANLAREQHVGQWLNATMQKLEEFEVIGLHLLDAPINGIQTEVGKFHELIEKAIAAHDAHMAKKYGPPRLTAPGDAELPAAPVNPDPVAGPGDEPEVKVDIRPQV